VVRNWPTPTTMKELNSFLGFANYYRKFVKSFSDIAYPLEELAKKDKSSQRIKLTWNDIEERSFNKLKDALTSATVLHTPNENDTFLLDVDASLFAIGAVLSQIDSNGVERPVYFASNKLSAAEKNYCTTRRELLAVVRYVKFFHHYLVGKKFLIRTDHRSLSWLLKWKVPSSSQYFRWIAILQEYSFDIVHREGRSHCNADALSRLEFCKQCKSDHVNAVSKSIKRLDEENTDMNKVYLLVDQSHSFLGHIGSNNLFLYLSKHIKCSNLRKVCKEVCSKCLICLKRKSKKSMKIFPSSLLSK